MFLLTWFWFGFGGLGAGSGEQEVGSGGESWGIGIPRFLSVLGVFECGSCGLPRLDLDGGLEVLGFEFGSVMRR